jgi:transcriptional regulator with XRE-family HTH domain
MKSDGPARLAKWLKRHGKRQVDLAEDLNVSQAVVSTWLRGISAPRLETALQLEELTKIPVAAWV